MTKCLPVKGTHDAREQISFKNLVYVNPQTRAMNPKQNQITSKKMNCSSVANWLWMLLLLSHLHSFQAAFSGDGIIIDEIQ